MKDRIESTILTNLIYNEDYLRKVLPFIEPDYFDNRIERIVFEEISQFITKYDKLPSQEIVSIEIRNRTDLTQDEYSDALKIVNLLVPEEINQTWLLDSTEKWCKDRAIYLALMESIRIADGGDEKKNSWSWGALRCP